MERQNVHTTVEVAAGLFGERPPVNTAGEQPSCIPLSSIVSSQSCRKLLVRGLAYLLLLILSGCGAFRGDHNPADWDASELRTEAAWQEAKAELVRQQSMAPREPYWTHRIGELAFESGRGSDAETAWKDALEIQADYAPALSHLTRKLYSEDRHIEAIELLEDLCASPAGCREELLAALALHYEAIGEQERAESIVMPYRIQGEHWGTIGAAITYLTLQGDAFADAPRLAERALAASPQSAANCNNLGIGLLQEGLPEEARQHFLKALELDPERPGPLYNLAIVERFYFFDDRASALYFSRYRALSENDPDGLGEFFGDAPPDQSESLEGATN